MRLVVRINEANMYNNVSTHNMYMYKLTSTGTNVIACILTQKRLIYNGPRLHATSGELNSSNMTSF